MKRILSGLLCALLAVACIFPVVGCSGAGSASSADSSALEAQLNSTLSDLMSCKGEAIQIAEKVVSESGIQDQLDSMGLGDEELCRAYLDDFDCEVSDVLITGSSAEAKLTITRRSITQIVKSFVAATIAGDVSDVKGTLLSIISATEATRTETTLYLSQSNGEWDVNNALSQALQKACL